MIDVADSRFDEVPGRALVVHLDPERARTGRHHFDVGHAVSVRAVEGPLRAVELRT
jgi:hypothetical protein